jgi:hypothetical protein
MVTPSGRRYHRDYLQGEGAFQVVAWMLDGLRNPTDWTWYVEACTAGEVRVAEE